MTENILTQLSRELDDIQRRLNRIEAKEYEDWVMLSAPLTSTSWDGDARSTTAKTSIDLSAVFAVPAGVRAILAYVQINDSASSTTDCYFGLSPNNTAGSAIFINTGRAPNDYANSTNMIVPCDANGDVYFQCAASGAGTLDVVLQIWGYLR